MTDHEQDLTSALQYLGYRIHPKSDGSIKIWHHRKPSDQIVSPSIAQGLIEAARRALLLFADVPQDYGENLHKRPDPTIGKRPL